MTRACRDRTRGNGFQLKKGRLTLDTKKEILHYEGGETLGQVAQRSCGCLLPEIVHGQVGWAFEQPGLVEGVPAYSKVHWNYIMYKAPSNPNKSIIL